MRSIETILVLRTAAHGLAASVEWGGDLEGGGCVLRLTELLMLCFGQALLRAVSFQYRYSGAENAEGVQVQGAVGYVVVL